MTAEKMAPNAEIIFRRIAILARRGLSLLGQLVFGSLVILAAGVLALATAVIGLILALAALVIGLASGRRRVFVYAAKPGTGKTPPADGRNVTLEARETPRGWTVE